MTAKRVEMIVVSDGGDFGLAIRDRKPDPEAEEPEVLEVVVFEEAHEDLDDGRIVRLTRADATAVAKLITDKLGYTLITGPDDL